MEILFIVGLSIFILSLIGMWINVANGYSAPNWYDNLVIAGVVIGGFSSALCLVAIARDNDDTYYKYYISDEEIIITDTIYSSGDTLYIYQLKNSKIKSNKIIE